MVQRRWLAVEPLVATFPRWRQAVLLVVGGLAVLRFATWSVQRPSDWRLYIVMAAIVSVSVLLGFWASTRPLLVVSDDGIRYRSFGSIRTMRLHEVAHWQLAGTTKPFPMDRPKGNYWEFEFRLKDGRRWVVGTSPFRDPALGERVAQRLLDLGIPQETG